MQSGTDKKPKPIEIKRAKRRAYYHMVLKPIQIAKEKAARAAMTPEQKAADAAYHHDYWLKNKERMMAQRRADSRAREKALKKYHGATEEEIAARKERWAKYARENRERLLANKRARGKRSYAAMIPEQKALANQRQRDYYAAHRAEKKVIRDRARAKKRALAERRASVGVE